MTRKVSGLISFSLSAALLLALGTPVLAGFYGYSTTDAPVCTSTVPAKAWLYMAKASGAHQVDLFWDKVNDTSSWTVAYGVQSGKYIYGVSGIGNGDSRSMRISMLPSGKYYFVVRANNGCMPGPFSNEWAVSLGGGTALTGATLTNVETAPQETPMAQVVPGQGNATPFPQVTFSPQQQKGVLPTPTPAPKSGGLFDWLGSFFSRLFK